MADDCDPYRQAIDKDKLIEPNFSLGMTTNTALSISSGVHGVNLHSYMGRIMYTIKADPSGRGIFAAQDIHPGTLILAEPKLLGTHIDPEASEDQEGVDKEKMVENALQLSDESFQQVKMHCERNFGAKKAYRLTKTNLKNGKSDAREHLFATVLKQGLHTRSPSEDEEIEQAICELYNDFHALRYSCNPNAQLSWSPTNEVNIRAVKFIKAGEEIVWAQDNPFRRKEERLKLLGAADCRCGICTGLKRKGAPNEQIYIEIESKFDIIHRFRRHFFKENEVVDFSTAFQDQALFDKAKAINAFSRKEVLKVATACQWLIERREQYNVMHSCFAELYEIHYIIYCAFAVEHHPDLPENATVAGDETSPGDSTGEGEKTGLDESNDTPPEGQNSESPPQGEVLAPVAASEDGHNKDDDGSGSQQADLENDKNADSPGTSTESSDGERLPGYAEALADAYKMKVQEMTIKSLCLGLQHHTTWQAIKHVWEMSGSMDRWREELPGKTGRLGFLLEEQDDGGFVLVELVNGETDRDGVAQAEEGLEGVTLEG